MPENSPYAALLGVLLVACGGQQSTACMEVADDATECPPPAEVDKDALFGDCGSTIRHVDGPGELMPFYGFGSVPIDSGQEPGVQCCYPVTESKPTCVYGRPYIARGAAIQARVLAADRWAGDATPNVDGLPDEARRFLAGAWAEAALDEHAAVAAFGKVALELLALGAPPELVAATHRAAIEEVAHAQMGFALASAYAGEPVGPGGFPFDGAVSLHRTLVALAVAAAREGCLGETLTTLVVGATLPKIEDPAVRTVMTRILAEEQGHAALAWRTVRWAIDAGGEPVRAAVAEVFQEALRDGVPIPVRRAEGPHRALLVAHGVPDEAICVEALRRGLAEVIAPAARALLVRPDQRGALAGPSAG